MYQQSALSIQFHINRTRNKKRVKKARDHKYYITIPLQSRSIDVPQTLLKKERIFPCLGPVAFPPFLAPALTPGFVALLPKAGDFLAAEGLD